MSFEKHTPGPWRWAEGTDAIDVDWNGKSWTIASVGNCRLGWHEDRNCEGREAGANARLIAEAPKLLEQLKQAESLIPHLVDLDDNHVASKVLADIRATIAKATGGAA